METGLCDVLGANIHLRTSTHFRSITAAPISHCCKSLHPCPSLPTPINPCTLQIRTSLPLTAHPYQPLHTANPYIPAAHCPPLSTPAHCKSLHPCPSLPTPINPCTLQIRTSLPLTAHPYQPLHTPANPYIPAPIRPSGLRTMDSRPKHHTDHKAAQLRTECGRGHLSSLPAHSVSNGG